MAKLTNSVQIILYRRHVGHILTEHYDNGSIHGHDASHMDLAYQRLRVG